jgi:hypothetical protein
MTSLRTISVRTTLTTLATFVALVHTLPLFAQANPNQVALPHWYMGNNVSIYSTNGSQPWGMVYDGANIWVINNSTTATLAKIRPSDGVVLATFSLNHYAQLIAYDGVSLWVTDANGTVTKVRPSDGAVLATTSVSVPHGIVFDGTSIWVTTSGNTLQQLRVSDGAIVGTLNIPCVAFELAFDGSNIWGSCISLGKVFRVSPSTGSIAIQTVGTAPRTLAFDGTNMWVANSGSGSVTKIRAQDMFVLGTFTGFTSTQSLVFDGVSIWVTSAVGVEKIRIADGALLGFVNTPNLPSFVIFDGTNVWASMGAGGTVEKI